MNRRHLLAGCALACVAVVAPATAQTTTAPGAGNTSSGAAGPPDVAARQDTQPENAQSDVADIVVTATRDPSRESKTPVSMQVYSSSAIAQKGITSVQALANVDSSVNINSGGGQPFVALRGVSTSDTSEVGDPGIPVSIDNLFTNRSYALNTGLFDINRIEILRGPQGTLFGRNAVGGVINIYTNDPAKELGGYVEGEFGNYSRLNGTGALNLPLSDTFQARAAFSIRTHGGFRDLGAVGHGENEDILAGRLKLAWQPVDGLQFGVQYQHNRVHQTGVAEQLIPFQAIQVANPTPGGAPLNILDRTVRYQGNSRSYPLQYKPVEKLNQDTLHWNGSYEFGGGITLSYLGGYDDLRRFRVTPQSSVAANPFGFPNAGFVQAESAKTLNQELRLSSAQGDRLTWQVGSFYFHERGRVNTSLFFNYQQPTQILFLNFNYPKVTSESIAGYGQASYAVTDALKLTAGVRYTDDKKRKVGGIDTLNLKAFAPFLPTLMSPSSGRSHSGVWTYHFGADYQASPQTLIYAHADKGYKAGGYNSGNAVPYDPEVLYAYEAGTKNRLLDGHLTLNLAAFYQLYKNQQVFESVDPLDPANNGATSLVQNVGKSHIYGVEAGLVAAGEGLGRLDLNASYVHARFVDYRTKDQALDGGSLPDAQLKGNTLPNSPDLSITAGYEYGIAAFRGTITPRIDGKYQSTKYFTARNTRDGRQGDNVVANASIRYSDDGNHYLIELFVRNLTNKTVLTDFTEQKDSKVYAYGFIPPRTYGGRVRFNF